MTDLNKPAASQPDYDSKRKLKRYGGMSGQVFCLDADVASLEAENERLRNDNAVLRDLAAAANPPKLSPEQLQRLRDLEQEKP